MTTVLAVVALACGDGTPEAANDGPTTPSTSKRPARPSVAWADHHLHIESLTAAEVLVALRQAIGEEDGKPAVVTTAEDVIAALDAAGIEGGVVLSNAYMFGAPDIEMQAGEQEEKVRAENLYVAEQVAPHADRLVALCSVNPIMSYALAEVERCAADSRIAGLKLHLANSDVDFANADHVERMRQLFARLEQLELPLLVHVRNRNETYGAADARIFIDEILGASPSLPIQIAHMAGWGGYDDATDSALAEFLTAIETGRLQTRSLFFGLGAVVFNPQAAGDNEELAAQVRESNQKLAERIRQLGTERVVYATDWPGWPPVKDRSTGIASNIDLLREALPLDDAELDAIFDNLGFWFEKVDS